MNERLLLIIFAVLTLSALIAILYPLHNKRPVNLVFAPFVLIFVSVAYWYWGSWSSWSGYLDQETRKQQLNVILRSLKDPEEVIKKLSERLKENPNSARGWYLLGRIYAGQRHWLHARDAFARSYQLNSKDEATVVHYVHSLWEINQQRFNAQTRRLLKTLLRNNPHQPDALSMLAMDAFTQHDYSLAISYWQKLLRLIPSRSQEAKAIRKALSKAQAGLK